MILTFARWSTCHSLSRKGGFNTQIPVTSERRKISNDSFQHRYPLKYCYHKRIRGLADNSGNNKSRHTSKKQELLSRYSKDQQHLDSNMPRRLEFNKLLLALNEFCRPYTMLGMGISVTSLSLLPLTSLADVSPAFLVGALKALVLFLVSQVFVSGINEIYDVEIDKVNKPYLPLASGEISMEFAVAIVSMSLFGCLAMGIMFRSPPLLFGVLVYCLFGAVYSVDLPYLRWKKNSFLVATCLIVPNGLAIPFAIFVHIQKYVLGRPILFTSSILFASCFASLFGIVIALSKDIPDIEGDRQFGLKSLLSIRLGPERAFWISVSTLLVTYGVAMGIGASSSFLLSKLVTVLGHFSLACIALHRALSVDLSVEGSAFDFYMFLWKLLYAEYFLIPLIR